MSKDSKELAVVNFQVPVVSGGMSEAMEEEMDGLKLTFDRVKIPSGGAIMFEVPSDNPDEPDMQKELSGVIVDHHPINGYWKDKFTGASNPPDCASMDGKFGNGNPGGICAKCPLNQFGSGENGEGKACKNMHRIYLLENGELFPKLLTLPPSSIRNFSDYMGKRIVMKGLRSYGVITKVTLKKEQNKGGITYSEANFAISQVLPPDITAAMAKYSAGIKAETRLVEIVNDVNAPIEEPVDEVFPE